MSLLFIIYAALAYILILHYPQVAPILAAAAIHEAGHLVASRMLGVKICKVNIQLCGIRIQYNDSGLSLLSFSVISLAGCAAGIISALAVMLTPISQSESAVMFSLISLTLSAVNLLPVRGLDGGVLTTGILDRLFTPENAAKIGDFLSGIFSILMWLVALRVQLRVGVNVSLLIVSVCMLLRSLFAS